jgi:hypothetical protein
MNHYESEHQRAVVDWASMASHHHITGKIGDYLIAIPNGGARGKVEAVILKAEGVKAGVSDLFLAIPMGGFSGLWIEMKIKPNKVTDSQIAWITRMASVGYAAIVCWSCDEARAAILKYLN